MRVYMTHPKHGAMHVYQKWQLEDNLKHGWSVAEENPVRSFVPDERVGADAFHPSLASKRGPGRPRRNTTEAADG